MNESKDAYREYELEEEIIRLNYEVQQLAAKLAAATGGMNTAQIDAIRCAQADLIGALQAYKQGDMETHDWKAHALTIEELTAAFHNILEPVEFEEDEE